MKCRVFYSNDPMRFLLGISPKVPMPTEAEIRGPTYTKVVDDEVPEDTLPDTVFVVLNSDIPLHAGTHTSMSVGDAVELGSKLYICLPTGWEELDTKEVNGDG